MTDIRRHGFESDAQWREYLAEIEDAAAPPDPDAAGRQEDVVRALARLSADVENLRERVEAHLRHRAANPRRRWLGLCLVLTTLAVAFGWRAANRRG